MHYPTACEAIAEGLPIPEGVRLVGLQDHGLAAFQRISLALRLLVHLAAVVLAHDALLDALAVASERVCGLGNWPIGVGPVVEK